MSSISIGISDFIERHRYELGDVISFAKFVESSRYQFLNYDKATFKAGDSDIVIDMTCRENRFVEVTVSKIKIDVPQQTLDMKIYTVENIHKCLWETYIELLNYWKL